MAPEAQIQSQRIAFSPSNHARANRPGVIRSMSAASCEPCGGILTDSILGLCGSGKITTKVEFVQNVFEVHGRAHFNTTLYCKVRSCFECAENLQRRKVPAEESWMKRQKGGSGVHKREPFR